MATPKDNDARKFWRLAKQRLTEAKQVLQIQLWALAEYVGGYAVECSLKALVLGVTPENERPKAGEATIEWMKTEFGHELDNLRRHLSARGARMPSDVAREFLFVATWNPQQRYEPGPGDPKRAERFIRAADSVVKWADGRTA